MLFKLTWNLLPEQTNKQTNHPQCDTVVTCQVGRMKKKKTTVGQIPGNGLAPPWLMEVSTVVSSED